MLNHIVRGERNNPAILFLHGFMGCAADWQWVMDQLADRYYCLAVDLPGHGATPLQEIPESRIIAHLTDTLKSFLKFHNIPQVILTGYSMGGRLALEMIRHNSAMISAVILESTSLGIIDNKEKQIRLKVDFALADRLEKEDFNLFLHEWYQQPVFASLSGHADLSQLIAAKAGNDPLQLAKVLRGFSVARQESSWRMLNHTGIPCLYMAGETDVRYRDFAIRLKAESGKTRVAIIPDAGHNIHWEQPEKYVNAMLDFLKAEV